MTTLESQWLLGLIFFSSVVLGFSQFFVCQNDVKVVGAMRLRRRDFQDFFCILFILGLGLAFGHFVKGNREMLAHLVLGVFAMLLIAILGGLRLRMIARQNGRNAALDVHQDWLRQGLMDFSEGVVREVMVPMRDVFSVSVQSSLETILQDPEFTPYSRLPVWQGEPDNIVGVVYSKELLHSGMSADQIDLSGFDVSPYVREPYFVPEVMEQVRLLKEFQSRHIQMAIVVDEFGVSSGVVTLEDLMETVIGDMGDRRNDYASMIEQTGLRDWHVDAMIDLQSFSELVGHEFESDLVETLGGYVFQSLGHVPQIGHKLVLNQLEFEILEMEGYRIRKLQVRELKT